MRRAAELREKMDDPMVGPANLRVSLRFIRRVNRFLGGTAAVMGHVRRFAAGWKAGERITVLDVATGSADIPEALLAWAHGSGRDVQVIGLDLHPTTLAIAQEWTRGVAGLSFVRGDALRLPLADGAVDYAISSMFLHHLSEEDAVAAIREMVRVSRRGVIVNDLLRSRWAYAGIWALTLGAAEIDKFDARVSVRKGWTRAEAERWPAAVGARWLEYRGHAWSRFTLAGERGQAG